MQYPAANFPSLEFSGTLRPSQRDAVEIARRKLAEGHRRLHIVAPPGSGKTILGLYLWAEFVKRPALVLSPNSAIQAQWASKAAGFAVRDDRGIGESSEDPLTPGPSPDHRSGGARAGARGEELLTSTDSERPAWLTSLTYQAVTLPRRGDDDLDAAAVELWIESLIQKEQADDIDEARAWIEDLQRRNADYHAERLASYRKQHRDELAQTGEALPLLHASSRAVLQRLKERGVGLIILDECHHLLGHWGRVLADASEFLDGPIILGLTATPPDRDGKDQVDLDRYDQFFGPIDFEVPIPAVVKDGFLAPYQDLAYFVRPTAAEIDYVANIDDQFHELVQELCAERSETHVATEVASERGGVSSLTLDLSGMALATGDSRSTLSGDLPAASAVPLTKRVPLGVSPPVLPQKADAQEPGGLRHPAQSSNTLDDESGIESLPARLAPMPGWVMNVLTGLKHPTGVAADWSAFEKRDATFAKAACLFLLQRGLKLPKHVIPTELDDDGKTQFETEVLVPVIDRYVRHGLRRSHHPADRELAETAIGRMRLLGVQITETGCQACASPAGRVIAYSKSKMLALPEILRAERAVLGDRIRAVIVTDYEKTSAVSSEISHLLDEEAGGAMAAFRVLIGHAETNLLDPVLVTGSSVLVDGDLALRLKVEAETWLKAGRYEVELSLEAMPLTANVVRTSSSGRGRPDYEDRDALSFSVLSGRGADWCPRVYVALITELFQRGLTRCLVGTRGLLGEGWDAHKINVLIDLTTVTTSMSVNQLRGRSFRLDPDEPLKLANNWDVVCLAPEFTQGLDDYHRLIRKHGQLFGVTEDGVIEKGIGHVHAAFTELKPEGVEGSVGVLNEEMLARVGLRDAVRERWKIGQPYHPEPLRTVEVRPCATSGGGFPPFGNSKSAWTDASLSSAIGKALLGALTEAKLIGSRPALQVGERAGGYVRLFLEHASKEESGLFAESLQEMFAPLHKPRYVIPRSFDRVQITWLSRLLPGVVGRYFQRRESVLAMWHAVPSALAKNRELVAIFERHWQQHVSPGEAKYAYTGDGANIVKQARQQGLTPHGPVHVKEVFL